MILYYGSLFCQQAVVFVSGPSKDLRLTFPERPQQREQVQPVMYLWLLPHLL